MRLTEAERLILENQRAIMYALRYPRSKNVVLGPRLDITAKATLIVKRRKKRKPKMDYSGPGGGAFMSDVHGDA